VSGCDFDDGLCEWTSLVEDTTIFGFDLWTGQTETAGTGPDDDFSTPGCTWFFSLCSTS